MTGKAQLTFLTLGALTASLVGCGGELPLAPNGGERTGSFAARAKTGELIVRFRSVQGRQAVLQKLGLRAVKKVARLDAIVVTAGDPQAALEALNRDPGVAYAEPNYIARAVERSEPIPRLGLPDELLGKLWGLEKIEAQEAWAVTRGDAKVKVAVVDTGVDWKHPDFNGRVLKGRDFTNNDDDAMDDQGHGTHVAGTIGAGLGNGGVVGVAPGVSLLAVKVLGGNGSGTYEGVANGIIYAADQGADVISMSLGGPAGSKVIEDAVAYAQKKGSLVVAAMGNENTESASYPAASPGVMAVGATTARDLRSGFSNYGQHISVSAPGSEILSTMPGGKYESLSGTSMATPHVSGLVALVKSRFPSLGAAELRRKVEASADDLGDRGFDKYFGHGRINARRALAD